MTPEELARRHPRLYHLTDPEALPGILQHGLLATDRLLDLFEASPQQRAVVARRRATGIRITHPVHGQAMITDNVPLSDAALRTCLDDGLSPAAWLALLNQRVFFWPDEAMLHRLANARLNRVRPRMVLVLNSVSLLGAHHARVEISPINSGATIRKPARRGLRTFTPMDDHDYAAWSRLRGRTDRVREITVLDGVADIGRHLITHYILEPQPGTPAAP